MRKDLKRPWHVAVLCGLTVSALIGMSTYLNYMLMCASLVTLAILKLSDYEAVTMSQVGKRRFAKALAFWAIVGMTFARELSTRDPMSLYYAMLGLLLSASAYLCWLYLKGEKNEVST